MIEQNGHASKSVGIDNFKWSVDYVGLEIWKSVGRRIRAYCKTVGLFICRWDNAGHDHSFLLLLLSVWLQAWSSEWTKDGAYTSLTGLKRSRKHGGGTRSSNKVYLSFIKNAPSEDKQDQESVISRLSGIMVIEHVAVASAGLSWGISYSKCVFHNDFCRACCAMAVHFSAQSGPLT